METLLEIAKKITEMASPDRLRGGRETEDWIIAGSLMRRLKEAVKREILPVLSGEKREYFKVSADEISLRAEDDEFTLDGIVEWMRRIPAWNAAHPEDEAVKCDVIYSVRKITECGSFTANDIEKVLAEKNKTGGTF